MAIVWLAAIETAAGRDLRKILQHRAGGGRAVEHVAGLGQEAAAGLGQLDAAAHAIEQMRAVARLQRRNGGRGRRLRDAERLGGTGDVAALGDSNKNAQLLKGHRNSI